MIKQLLDSKFLVVFMRHFPIPRLRSLHQVLKEECEKGFYYCLDYVDDIVMESPMMKKKGQSVGDKIKNWFLGALKLKQDENPYAPFYSALQQFKFRASASYYMCWFTMWQQTELKHLGKNCPVPGKPHDFRSSDSVPFQCALQYFCPDPCCGRYNNDGVVPSPAACKAFPHNPCATVKDATCEVDLKNNRNFKALMRNRINITCDCQKFRKGFKWSMEFKECIDKDECYDGDFSCGENQVCRNTVGSYRCLCRRGFKVSEKTGKCVRQLTLYDDYVDKDEEYQKGDKQEPPTVNEKTAIDLATRIEIFLGLTSATSQQRPSFVLVVLLTAYSILQYFRHS